MADNPDVQTTQSADEGLTLTEVRAAWRRIVALREATAVSERGYVELNGSAQWISVRGQDRSNPLLLFLHGGPGTPVSDFAYSYQRPWEDFFTVVNWDQRGFGRSFGSGGEPDPLQGTLNRAQYRADAIALIEHLLARFGQSKIVLVGQSWGTVLGLEVARARPDLLHALALQGLAANWMASPAWLWRHYIEKAAADGDRAEADRLRAIGPPTVENAMTWRQRFARAFPDENTWRNLEGGGDTWGARMTALYACSPEVDEADIAAMSARDANPLTLRRFEEAMASVLPWDARRDVGVTFDIPIVVMMGAHDWQTSRDLARDYYDELEAPWKFWVEFPNAAHALNIEQPGLATMALVNLLLPATRGQRPAMLQADMP